MIYSVKFRKSSMTILHQMVFYISQFKRVIRLSINKLCASHNSNDALGGIFWCLSMFPGVLWMNFLFEKKLLGWYDRSLLWSFFCSIWRYVLVDEESLRNTYPCCKLWTSLPLPLPLMHNTLNLFVYFKMGWSASAT